MLLRCDWLASLLEIEHCYPSYSELVRSIAMCLEFGIYEQNYGAVASRTDDS